MADDSPQRHPSTICRSYPSETKAKKVSQGGPGQAEGTEKRQQKTSVISVSLWYNVFQGVRLSLLSLLEVKGQRSKVKGGTEGRLGVG